MQAQNQNPVASPEAVLQGTDQVIQSGLLKLSCETRLSRNVFESSCILRTELQTGMHIGSRPEPTQR